MNFFKKKEEKENLIMCSFDKTLIMALVHRLRTPLNGARWLLESIISEKKDGDIQSIKESYNKVIESINIIEEVLSLFKDSKKLGFKKEKFDLCLLIDNILKNLKYLVQEKNNVIEFNKNNDCVAFADMETVELAVINVIDNALRYSHDSKVVISVDKVDKDLKLVVKDNGIGISPERLSNIFDCSMKGESTIEMRPGRSGIGLYTTRKIIEMNGGSIKINSKLDEGTVVTILLPLE
ncbi:MAG: HAMP domain-containing sensor histidine kinase [Candidatus Pacebacteria bacterium]|nr:HAMP domain-containing sensor histidine kinase [Candidatus Paceibacterota bacterium]